MVLKGVKLGQWSWQKLKYDLNVDWMDGLERNCHMAEFGYNLAHNGLERKWS